MTDIDIARTFDATGLRCPMPILKTKKEIKQIAIGEVLKVIATDVGTKKDFTTSADRMGFEIIEMKEEPDKLVWFLKRTK
jgi:tRNA 2-thiouridine synthesizing protein A